MEGGGRGCFLKNVIPYKMINGFTQQEEHQILHNIEHIGNSTCVRWVNMDKVTTGVNFTDYVELSKVNFKGCYTHGGRTSQNVFISHVKLGEVCFREHHVLHEMMHAMGFEHEHQRGDRNCYIKVDAEAERDDFSYSIFPSEPWLERFPYDKFSVMHYKTNNKIKVLNQPENLTWPLGGNTLSNLDVWKIKYKYCNIPHYCNRHPDHCSAMESMEASLNCSRPSPS